ncbi:hypothetical protein FRB90_006524 [Tulasnella sp. 427]|nr:hypothetical protein FRB90_006524 [Tulasnella sp. 427]
MKIDEDSVVFVVEGDDPVTQGRKNVIKVGGRHAGGGGAHSAVGGGRARTALAPPSAMASLSVMGAPAMAVQLGGQMDFKVVWLLQCFDSTMMHQWIAAVKGALLVQRAERAGLGMSLQTSPADVRLTGDIDVILSLRAQGLYNQPVSPTSPTTRHGAPPSTAPPVDEPQPSNRGGRSRASTTTVPSAAVHALKGLFTTSLANGPSSGSGAGTSSRPRSISSVASTPIPMASPPKKPTPLEEDPKDASFGTRANAMLNMHLARSAPGQQPPSSASSLMLDRSIRDSLSASGGGFYDDALVEMDFELKQKENRERLNALAAFAAGVNSGGSYERPPSVSSLPPPPRTKRPGSAGVGSVSSFQQQLPRTPVFEKDLQDELKKAMFAPVLEMGSQRSRSRTNSLRRNSTDTIPEEDDMSSSVGGRGSVLGRPREVLSIRTSIDEQGRVSIESTSNRSAVEDLVTTIPFPAPGSLLPPAELEHGQHLVSGGGRTQFGHVGMKSSASFGVDLIHAGSASASAHHHPAHAYYRPPSAMSSVSTNSFQGTGSATPGASDHMSLHMSPRSDTGSSDRRAKSATAPPATSSSSATRGPSSPQRSRRVPKVMIPPPAPPPSAPLPGTPKTDMAKALHPEDASVSTRERDSLRSSFFASKRVSAASSTGVSIRSFTSGSSSSRSGPGQRASGVHGGPPRPPPSFALPPTPGHQQQMVDSPLDEYSVRSLHRESLNSNGSRSDSPTRSEFGVVGHSPSPLGMGSGTMGKRLLNRLTPPSNPPPTGALPPRPDSDEPPISPTSHRSGSSGSINGSHQQQQHHHRTSSVISNGCATLSTIPASPVDKVLPDLSPLSRLPELPETTTKRVAVTSSPSLPPASLNGASSTVSLLRQSSLKSRLRMLSTPSPRIQPSATLPPTSALPDIPSITHAMKIVDQHSMSFDLALPSPTLDRPIISPFIPDDESRDSVNGSALPGHQTPPIPPRSQARPTSPRLKLAEAPQPPMMGLPLSPPPARRGNRMSKDYSLSGIARVNAALALDNPPSSFSLTPPLLEGDGIEPAEPPVEHWEPSRRDSVMIPL